MNYNKILSSYTILWESFSPREKKSATFILVLLIVSSSLEVLSLGSLIPFIAVVTTSESTAKGSEFIIEIKKFINFSSFGDLKLVLTGLYILVVISAAYIRSVLHTYQTNFVYNYGKNISKNIFRNFLTKPYIDYVKKNSSEILSDLTHNIGVVISSWIIPTINIIVALVLLIVTLTVLIIVNPILMLSTISVFGFLYLITTLIYKKSVKINTKIVADSAEKIIRIIQESTGNIRDIIIHNRFDFYVNKYKILEDNLRDAQSKIQNLNFVPKTIIETSGIVFIALLTYFLSVSSKDPSEIIVSLGLIAVSSQKLFPLLNQIYSSYINIQIGLVVGTEIISKNSSKEVNIDICQSDIPIEFNREIKLEKLFFKYDNDSDFVLKNINLNIQKYSCIGIIGRSGSGKSTLSDILLGLLSPNKGVFEIDDINIDNRSINSWRKHVAHVPQSIYLTDDTILANIAVGKQENEIDYEAVLKAIKLASLDDFINLQKDGLLTNVGERGGKLSGGQRQRIGIARALYEGAEFIVFDEPTSSLDFETEIAITNSLKNLKGITTMVIISHNKETLKFCDLIYEITQGEIINVKV
ncbi:MAG: hypothetical protein RLY43_1426 [Bacteroidota bacterium]